MGRGMVPPIRIAYVLDSFRVGGTELNAIRTAEQLDPERYKIIVACLQTDGPLRERYERLGIPISHFPIPNLYGPRTALQAVRMARYLAQQDVSIAHAHDIYGNIFGVPAARLAGVPAVIASRRWWKRTPRRGLGQLNRVAYRLSHRVLANSSSVARMLVNEEGVPAGKITVVPNFVEPEALAPLDRDAVGRWRVSLGIPADARVVGSVGRLAEVKDHETFLRALAEPGFRCLGWHGALIGDGELRGPLERLATSLGIGDRVHFVGSLPNRPNPHHLLDISVLCSLSEGFPNSIIEAMAAAKPVVATSVGGVPDAVVHGETGYLVPPRRPDALATALIQVAADEGLRRGLGARGFDIVQERFTATHALDALADMYQSLAGRATP